MHGTNTGGSFLLNSSGAFTLMNKENGYQFGEVSPNSYSYAGIEFKASNNKNSENPIAGHTSSDIRPFTILALPIYIY